MNASYEAQLAIVRGLPQPSSDDDRRIAWCVSGKPPIGVSRTPQGNIEIFLEGPALKARHRRVRAALEYQRWFRTGGDELLANRLLLPAAGHFEQVAAFLCTEIVRSGAATDLARAFAEAEPLIELTIADLLISDEVYTGLCGELLVLHSLLRAGGTERVREIVESWQGYRKAARDFHAGDVGVEVKATSGHASSHLFSGVHQFEAGHGVDGAVENGLLVVSVGLEWTAERDTENTTSLPELVDRIIVMIRGGLGAGSSGLVEELVGRIAAYGRDSTIGYDHNAMAGSVRYGRRFRIRFARGYDVTDPAIRLLTTDDVRARPFIETDSLRMRVNFPDRVNGDVNPLVGLSRCAQWILGDGRK